MDEVLGFDKGDSLARGALLFFISLVISMKNDVSAGLGRMVRAIEREVFALEHVDLCPAKRIDNDVRANWKLDVRALFGALSLPRGASDAGESVALRFGGKRSERRTVSRRVYENQ